MLATLENVAVAAGAVSGLVAVIQKAMNALSEMDPSRTTSPTTSNRTFVNHQTKMVAAAKEIQRNAQEMVS